MGALPRVRGARGTNRTYMSFPYFESYTTRVDLIMQGGSYFY